MDSNTARMIHRINRYFYHRVAQSFSGTRQFPNPGWQRLLPLLRSVKDLRILDIGCGNGRFLSWLHENEITCEYLGLEQNTHLLQIAKQYESDTHHFRECDVLDIQNLQRLSFNPTLIVAFGVTHHLPSRNFRHTWFTTCANMLDSGYFIYTHWQIGQDPRFAKAHTDISIAELGIHIARQDLEEGDYFLTWQEQDVYRYVHVYSEIENLEIKGMLQSKQLQLIERFMSDGKTQLLNEYWIWRKI